MINPWSKKQLKFSICYDTEYFLVDGRHWNVRYEPRTLGGMTGMIDIKCADMITRSNIPPSLAADEAV